MYNTDKEFLGLATREGDHFNFTATGRHLVGYWSWRRDLHPGAVTELFPLRGALHVCPGDTIHFMNLPPAAGGNLPVDE